MLVADSNVVQGDGGQAAGLIQCRLPLANNPGSIGRQCKQADTGFADAARRACGNDQQLAIAAIDHIVILAIEAITPRMALRIHLHGAVVPARRAGVGEAGANLTGGNQRQPAFLECFIATEQQGRGGQAAGCKEWCGQQAAPELFLEQTDFDKAQAKTSIGLGDRQCGPIQLPGHSRPGSGVVPLIAGHGRAHRSGAGHLVQKTFGGCLNHSLFVCQGKLHMGLVVEIRIKAPA